MPPSLSLLWSTLSSWLGIEPMAITRWDAPFAGWTPRLSPDAKYCLVDGRIVDVASKETVALPHDFRSSGWLNPTQCVTYGDLSGTDKEWHAYRFDAPTFDTPVELGPSANFHGAGGNTWAGGTTRSIWSGDAAGHAKLIAAGYAATVDELGVVAYSIDVHTAPRLVVWKSGQIVRTIVPARAPNRFLVGAGGYVGYGYYGPAWLNTPSNVNTKVNVTDAEGPPLAFRHAGAVWLATTNDEGVYLRPLGVTDRAILVSIPYHDPYGGAVDCSVVSRGDVILVASCDAKGTLSLSSVPANTPLAPVRPVEPPRPPITIKAKATIASYVGSVAVNEPATAVAEVTQGTPTHFNWQFQQGVTWTSSALNPAADLDHSYTFTTPGRYPIRMQTLVNGKVTDTTSSTSRAITVTAGAEPPDPGPDPGPEPEPPPEARKGIVHGNTFVMTDDGGQWLPYGTSLFWALYGWLHERSRVEQHFAWAKEHGFDFVRVIATGLRMGTTERSVSPKIRTSSGDRRPRRPRRSDRAADPVDRLRRRLRRSVVG